MFNNNLFLPKFTTFGISPLLKAIYNLYLSVYIFSNSNTKYIFNLIAPGLGDKVVAYMEKYKGKSANTVKEEINKEKPIKYDIEKYDWIIQPIS